MPSAPTHTPKSVVLDSQFYDNVLPSELLATAYDDLQAELTWSEMYHKGGAVPRLVCIQGEVDDDGVQPIYRHPADEQPPLHAFTPTVSKLRDIVSETIGQPLNHALIQMYRSGDDFISEHADKTIDVARGSAVVNLSLGASRNMVLRPKKDKKHKKTEEQQSKDLTTESPPAPVKTNGGGGDANVVSADSSSLNSQKNGAPTKEKTKKQQQPPPGRPSEKVELTHGSLFVLGWDTNRLMTHEVRKDKRPEFQKTEAQLAYGGCRISLTFRNVATFIKPNGELFGQGAPRKAVDDEAATTPSSEEEKRRLAKEEEKLLIEAFSTENRSSDFDWDEIYGNGFSVVNFKTVNSDA